MSSLKTCPSVTFYFMKISFSDIDRKWILPNMIRVANQSQFTPKMKANAVSRLLSSLVWIDQYYECNRLTALIIFWQNTLPVNFRKLVFFMKWNVTELQVCKEFMSQFFRKYRVYLKISYRITYSRVRTAQGLRTNPNGPGGNNYLHSRKHQLADGHL